MPLEEERESQTCKTKQVQKVPTLFVLTNKGQHPKASNDEEHGFVGERVVGIGVGDRPPPVDGDDSDGEGGNENVHACGDEKQIDWKKEEVFEESFKTHSYFMGCSVGVCVHM